MNTIEAIVQNNLCEIVLYLTRAGSYEEKHFGQIVSSYSYLPGPDYNMIFDFPAISTSITDLRQALTYSHQTNNPFMLVRAPKISDPDVDKVIAEFNYNWVGAATRMAIVHDEANLQGVDTTTVKQVTNQQMLDQFCDIANEVYEMTPGNTQKYYSKIKGLLDPDFAVKLYLCYATVNGQLTPVGTTMLHLPQDQALLAGHYGWAVKLAFRNRGIMSNLVKNMILVAQQSGFTSSVAQCYDLSVGLAEKLGFKAYGDLDLYIRT